MEKTSDLEVLKDLFCGCLGGLFGTLASHPLDTIRIRLQIQDSHNKAYTGISDWCFKTVKFEGVSGLFKGITPIVLSQWPVYALVFAGKEFGGRLWDKYTNYSETNKSLIAGCIGGAVSTIIACPAELLKIRSQSNTKSKTNYGKLLRQMAEKEGKMSVYKGYVPTILRDIPAYAVYFGIFDIGWQKFIKQTDPKWKELLTQLVLGSLAGIGSVVVPYPFDIIKTLMQDNELKLTMRKVFRDNYRKYGYRFLFKGMGASSIATIPMDAMWLMVYSQLRQWL